MHITNSSSLTQLCLQRTWEPITTVLFHNHGIHHFDLHGYLTSRIPSWKDLGDVMHSLHDHYYTSLSFLLPSFILFLVFSFFLLLPKLLWSLHQRSNSKRSLRVDEAYSGETETETDLFYISDDCSGNEDLVADVVLGGEALLFLSEEKCHKVEDTHTYNTQLVDGDKESSMQDPVDVKDANIVSDSMFDAKAQDLAFEKPELDLIDIPTCDMSTPSDHYHTPHTSVDNDEEEEDEDDHSVSAHGIEVISPSPFLPEENLDVETYELKEERSSSEDDGFLVTVKGSLLQNKIENADEHFADNSTAGSTSKSSCEWRGSTNFRGSETDGFFSSSSRRSSSNWESYAVYRKYDEEMMFFDRVSTEKLRETESLRSIKVQPRSISERIVHKFSTKKSRPQYQRWSTNPYRELEAAYVAQICLAWEALNWNYKNLQRTTSDHKRKEDSGCPALVAQQFQQFQVLLQRFIENEPYEYGRRPEVYARMRISSPRLLQVPEFPGSEEDEPKEDMNSRIPSTEFLIIMEDAIRTFMNFLKGDREKYCCLQFLKAFTKSKSSSIDPTVLNMIKKANHKKKSRLKDLRRSRKCLRKKKVKDQDQIEILMGLIDVKIVSRVLRMPDITEEKLYWCEEKMSKVKFWNGRVQRDSSPLFFPAQ